MLEKLAIPAIVLPFLRQGKRAERPSTATHTKSGLAEMRDTLPPMSATDVNAAASVAEPLSKPTPEHVLPASVAIEQYCREMVAGWGGVDLDVALVHRGYLDMCADRGWPELPVKTLSQGLVKLGCQRRQLDLRKTGEGRPTVILFPTALVKNAAAARQKPRRTKGKGSPAKRK